ncbi:MAG: glycogen debranching N-terminal domain-containing protein [Gemmatimonadaceae bacterium]
MPHATVRSQQRYAWHGQSLLITNLHGECDADLPISGFYFREARFLRRLCFRINDTVPWLCEDAVISPRELLFAYAFPEVARYGGGGTGQSQDETPVDDHGLPQRAIDIRLRYRVAVAALDVDAIITNRSTRKALKLDL